MAFLRKNFAFGILAVGIDDIVIQLTMTAGHTLPVVAGTFQLTIWNNVLYPDPADALAAGDLEIVTASYSGTPNVYNITRAQEGTVAVAHGLGHRAALHYTAGMSENDLTIVANHAITHEIAGSDLISHDALTGFVADEHVDHSGVSVIAGTGMSGGGTIVNSRTLNCNITQYTDELAQDAVGGILDNGTVGNIVFNYDDVGGIISAITQDSEIDHNALNNTHNLTTDIDHNFLTNVHQDVNTTASPSFVGETITTDDPMLNLINSTDENGDGEANSFINFKDHGGNILAQMEAYHIGTADDSHGGFVLRTNYSGIGLQDSIKINHQGFVGIGTVPAAPFHILRDSNSPNIAQFFGQHATDDIIYMGASLAANECLIIGYNVTSDYGYLGIYGEGSTDALVIADGGNIGCGAVPVTQLTVEGTITLKEQASADGDTAAYGQLWIKNDTPNKLWFTDDAGTDFPVIPQNLQTTASPTFAGVSINSPLSYGLRVYADTAGSSIGFMTLDVVDNTSYLVHNNHYNGSWLASDNSVGSHQVAFLPTGNIDIKAQASGDGEPPTILTLTPAAGLTSNSFAGAYPGKFFSAHATDNAILIGTSSAANDCLVIGFNPASDFGFFGVAGDSQNDALVIADGGNIGCGVVPVTQLTVEGTITLKEQVAADGDTAAYGQIWVKSDSPNILMFTDDTGTDFIINLTPA